MQRQPLPLLALLDYRMKLAYASLNAHNTILQLWKYGEARREVVAADDSWRELRASAFAHTAQSTASASGRTGVSRLCSRKRLVCSYTGIRVCQFDNHVRPSGRPVQAARNQRQARAVELCIRTSQCARLVRRAVHGDLVRVRRAQTDHRPIRHVGGLQPARAKPRRVLAHDARAHGHSGAPHRLAAAVSARRAHAAGATPSASRPRAVTTATAAVPSTFAPRDADAQLASSSSRNTTAVALGSATASSTPAAIAGGYPVHSRGRLPSDLRKCLRPFNPHACLGCLELCLDDYCAQVSWSNADLKGTPESYQNMPCGTFYANLCATADSANIITSLLDLPPSSPPPPMPPDLELEDLTSNVVRVIASGGFRARGDDVVIVEPPPSSPPPMPDRVSPRSPPMSPPPEPPPPSLPLLLIRAPSPPWPPLPPVLKSSGRRLAEYTHNPLKQCTDGGDGETQNTPCIADGEERPVSCYTVIPLIT